MPRLALIRNVTVGELRVLKNISAAPEGTGFDNR